MAGGYYEERDQLWDQIPGIEFLEPDQFLQVQSLFTDFLDDVKYYHDSPQDSGAWRDLMDFMGLDDTDFPWQTFREWYEAA